MSKNCFNCIYCSRDMDEKPCCDCNKEYVRWEGSPNLILARRSPKTGERKTRQEIAKERIKTMQQINAEVKTTERDLDREIEKSIDSKLAHGSKKSAPFLKALTEVWKVSQFGEKKHGANNWRNAKADGMEHYEYALWRHWIERRLGETYAEDSKCRHLAHLAWNALMLLEMELRGVVNPEWTDEGENEPE